MHPLVTLRTKTFIVQTGGRDEEIIVSSDIHTLIKILNSRHPHLPYCESSWNPESTEENWITVWFWDNQESAVFVNIKEIPRI
jgi:hypothetical protein